MTNRHASVGKFQQLWPSLKRLLVYGLAYRQTLINAVILLVIAAAAEVSGPLLISYFIDHVLTKSHFSMGLALMLATAYLVLQSAAAVLHYRQNVMFNRTAVGVVQQLRSDVMRAALQQPLATFDRQPIGQIISRVTNDTEVVRDLYVTVFSTMLKSSALIAATLIAMFSLNSKMALVIFALFPIVGLVMAIYNRYSTPIVRRVRNLLAEITNGFNEAISGMVVIQQFRQQLYFAQKMNQASVAHYKARMQTLRLDGFLLRPLISLLFALVLCGVLLLFGASASGSLGVGVLYAFISYLSRLNEPLIELTSQLTILQQAVVAGERIFELMDAPQQRYGDDQLPLASGRIDIQQLSFAYSAGFPVLKEITLHIPCKSFIALVGHTGSGKSTLASLLMGYYPVTQGSLKLDGRELRQLSHHALRQGITMVQQDPVILADTVYANVTLGRDINEECVWQALECVQMAELTRDMPEGLHTILGEQGNNLSVGQKQLLALARALVVTPQILILDEATANIDSGTEQVIQTALQRIRQQTTLVVIAHRLSTVMDADSIVVLHRGQIEQQGTHQQLVAETGRYQQMYRLQQVESKLRQPKEPLI